MNNQTRKTIYMRKDNGICFSDAGQAYVMTCGKGHLCNELKYMGLVDDGISQSGHKHVRWFMCDSGHVKEFKSIENIEEIEN